MPAFVGASGAHKGVTNIHVGASSSWKRVIGGWVGAGGVWKRFLASIYTGSLTAGFWTIGISQYSGYRRIGGTDGTISPTAAIGASRTIRDLFNAAGSGGQFAVSGFSSDPGSTWLNYVKVGSVSFAAPGATYSYSGGTARWVWSGSFGMVGSTTYAIEISINE